MAVGNQVIDIGVDPLDERQRRRRRLLRIGIPLAGVVFMVVAILAIALYSDRANRRGALALSDDLLVTLDTRIGLEVAGYLDPASRAARIVRDMVRGRAFADPSLAVATGATVLREVPQVADLSFADQDGNYIMVRRGGAGGIKVKLIDNTPGQRRVTWIHHNLAGQETGREEDPKDKFDPRVRPWYVGAAGTDGMFWTGAYIFFTERKPGVTVSLRYQAPHGRLYVFGVDITLDALSRFLASLEIGRSGKALIMDSAGRLVASPTGHAVIEQTPDGPVAGRVDRLGDPVVTRAYDQFRIEGPGRRTIKVDGRRYIATIAPLGSAAHDWFVMITVPEADFTGYVTSDNRDTLLMSSGILLVALLLAALLVRQGLRADRGALQLLERRRAISRQSAAFASLAADASLFDPATHEPPRSLTETLVETTEARRASLWRFAGGRRQLRCEDSYDRDSAGHVDGLELDHDELPRFFGALEAGEEVQLADASGDRRTAEFHRAVMQPFGSSALLVMPVRRGDRTVGAICLEDAPQDARAANIRDFVLALANMIAPRMAEGPAVEHAAAPSRQRVGEAVAVPAAAGGQRSFTADLAAQGIDRAMVDAEVYAEVAVMVLRFTDPAVMALRPAEGAHSLSFEIVRAMQEVVAQSGIPYFKVVGHELVAAAGFDAGAGTAAAALIADSAIAVRDRCLRLFEESDRPPAFRIGIDCGSAMGSTVGTGPEIFNLWGEAMRTAEAMAASAVGGTVQLTEAAYQRLRGGFIFRRRGRFYLPRIGEARTFVLAGRS